MRLGKAHTDFTLPQVSYLDAQTLYPNRIFTNLLMLIKFDGQLPIEGKGRTIRAKEVAQFFFDTPDKFLGFADHPKIVTDWISEDFLDQVFRGNPEKQSVVSLFPLHLNSYKLRDHKRTSGYGSLEAARQVYTMMFHSNPKTIIDLREFLSAGMDPETDSYDRETNLDVETLTMVLLLSSYFSRDFADPREKNRYFKPFLPVQAKFLTEDISKLLAYRDRIPRRVLIEYIKTMMSFHLALYELHLFQELPAKLNPLRSLSQETNAVGQTSLSFSIITDMGEDYKSHMGKLAMESVSRHLEQMNEYVKTRLALKKLQEFGFHLVRRKKTSSYPQDLNEFLELPSYDKTEFSTYFLSQYRDLMTISAGEEEDERLKQIESFGLDYFQTYIEMLYVVRLRRHRTKYTEMLDTLMMKNKESGLLRQGRGSVNKRRFYLGSVLLEALIQIAVLETDPNTNQRRTKPILIDDFIEFLRNRYGIYVDRLPEELNSSIEDLEALRENLSRLKVRLREMGFFDVLSDSYKVQIIKPRFDVGVMANP